MNKVVDSLKGRSPDAVIEWRVESRYALRLLVITVVNEQ